ncbi:hypothetical protein GJ496_008225 [Pomphorhynchus laevis]|nr:hypothetical protein GJ496_008225 [Pomphorhynchus laevis]
MWSKCEIIWSVVILSANALFSSKSDKCPIVTLKPSAIGFTGYDLRISKEFKQAIGNLATEINSECKQKLAVRESFINLAQLWPEGDVIQRQASIGHAFSFEVVNPSGKILCNKKCLISRGDASNMNCIDDKLFEHGLRRNQDIIYNEHYDIKNRRFADKRQKIQKVCN